MKFYPLKGQRQVNVNISDYLIDWNYEVSKPQKLVSDFLRPYWKTHIVLSEFRIPGSLLRVDLLNLTSHVAIEVSPSSTHSFNKFFHKNNKFRFCASVQREMDKDRWLSDNKFKLVEIFDEDFPNLSREWFRQQGVEL